jgi:hypothetical protein
MTRLLCSPLVAATASSSTPAVAARAEAPWIMANGKLQLFPKEGALPDLEVRRAIRTRALSTLAAARALIESLDELETATARKNPWPAG